MTEVKEKDKKSNLKTDVKHQILGLEREFLELRVSKSAGQIKDASRFRKIKAEISRLRLKMSNER